MRFLQFSSILLPLLVKGSVQSAVVQNGQLGQLEWLREVTDNPKNSAKSAFKIEELKPTLSILGVKRKRFIYGPYTIFGMNSTQKKGALFHWPPKGPAWQSIKPGDSFSLDEDGTGYTHSVGDDFLADATVLKVDTGILTKDFKRAETRDGIYNHHNLWFDGSKSSTSAFGCDIRSNASRDMPATIFSVGGAENIALDYANPNERAGDVKTGYYLKKNRRMLNMIDVVNYAKEDQQVYQSIDIEYLDGKPQGRLDVVQVTFDPFMCNKGKGGHYTGINIRPEPGQSKFSVNAEGIVVKKNGYLVSMRGHLHDGGTKITMRVNNMEVCNSRALYGGPGHTTLGPDGRVWETINEMTNCHYTTKVNKGDKISVEANYDLEKHPSRLIPSNTGGGGHAGHGKTGMKIVLDGGEGEQMALFSVYFADEPSPGK